MPASRVLIIDYQSVERTLFEGCLVAAGWEVFACRTAGDALDVLQTEEVQLVVCAHRPPDLDGLGFCAQAQPLLGSQRIPVILTGELDAVPPEVLGELGSMIARVLPDPVYVVDLRTAIDQILGSQVPRLLQDSNPPPLPLVAEGLALADVVRALGKGGHDLRAVVSSLGREPADPLAGKVSGTIDFYEGRPVGAELGGATGPEVFFRLMSWRRTRIELREPPESFTPNLEDPPDDLLLEGTRRHSAWLKQKAELPATDTVVHVTQVALRFPDRSLAPEAWDILRAALTRPTLATLLGSTHLDRAEAGEVIQRLISDGLLETGPASSIGESSEPPSLSQWLASPSQKDEHPGAGQMPPAVAAAPAGPPAPSRPPAAAAEPSLELAASDFSEALVDDIIAVSRELPALEDELESPPAMAAPPQGEPEALPKWVDSTVLPHRPRRLIGISAAVAGLAAGALWWFYQGPGAGLSFESGDEAPVAPVVVDETPAFAWSGPPPGVNYVERQDLSRFRGSLGIPNFVEMPVAGAPVHEVPSAGAEGSRANGDHGGHAGGGDDGTLSHGSPATPASSGGQGGDHPAPHEESADDDDFLQNTLVPVPRPEPHTDPWTRQLALQERQAREHAAAMPLALAESPQSHVLEAPAATKRREPPAERRAEAASVEACQAGEHESFRSFLKACERALSDFPGHPGVLTAIAARAYETGRHSVSGRWARKALRAGARDPGLYRYLGFAEQRAGRTEASRQAYTKYLELAPEGEHAEKVRAALAAP